jgi:hypothetical protein
MSESSDATPSDVAVASPPPRRHRWTVGRPLLEVVLIALGVFLGLAAEQWRDRSERQERATETLRRIRAEMVANREAVRRVVGYHANALVQLKSFLSTPVPERDEKALRMEGIQSAQFESTAWQLAQTTQALVDIDADLSFSLARVYGVQALYQGLTDGINNAMYLRPPTENMTAFRHSLALYYGDIVIIEPALEKLYDEVLPQIDRALDR